MKKRSCENCVNYFVDKEENFTCCMCVLPEWVSRVMWLVPDLPDKVREPILNSMYDIQPGKDYGEDCMAYEEWKEDED